MNPARENILARVRRALRQPAPPPAAPRGTPIWPAMDEPFATFQREFTAVKGEIVTDLPAFLSGFTKIASALPDIAGNSTPAEAELGVTGCDCLIARTGSIALATRSAGGRLMSVLPATHLVVARRAQVVPELADALALWQSRYGQGWPSQLVIVTGPSRTADIEKILVMGAHGPKRLAVYFAA